MPPLPLGLCLEEKKNNHKLPKPVALRYFQGVQGKQQGSYRAKLNALMMHIKFFFQEKIIKNLETTLARGITVGSALVIVL